MGRVTERYRYDVANSRVERAKELNTDALNHLSTQSRINTLRDDPMGLAQTIKLGERLSEINSFRRNIDYTKGYLEVTETAISSIIDRLSRAKELAIAMANDTYAADSRDATAKEVSQLIDQVIGLGNSKYNGKYVFSGFRTLSPALDEDGNFLGDDGKIFLQVGNEHFKAINIPGRELFNTDQQEVDSGRLGVIASLQLTLDGMLHNDKHKIYKAIESLEFQANKVTSFQASVGATANAIEEASKKLGDDEYQRTLDLSRIKDIDFYKVSSDYKRTETILQSTLLATNKFLQPSLLNFMQ